MDNLYAKTVNYRPNIDNLEDLVINVDFKLDSMDELKKFLSDSHQISFDALRDEQKRACGRKSLDMSEKHEKAPLMTIDSLFLKDEHWLCTLCGQR